mmetsp:Transcript_28285/g.38939  ORF Transcript_28285/g.38939 Transcript_28285/m.38939 type:complete len:432 (-) Transcript_28285:295-1590(-)|eukprot:CAMPEP_0170077926 /NCGR_PEP_ID=MMETSP0019_2-20121128/14619_1 /TAXON_ID=98059 /ORGANISM="Dinobryon sp., Strain UTEXLB2267" /LENGTH=431 /DNA_ID=CAMNT_0010290495 /DNA_START=86 /DNA_END=1381 /DNA_ORIENTATION=-
MKFSVKTIKGDLFKVEAEPTDSVAIVKQKIQETRADLVAERQKLIHSGKILKDDQTISELGLSESDFIVCMVTKETTKSKPVEQAPAPAPSSASAIPSQAPTISAPSSSSTAIPPATAESIAAPVASLPPPPAAFQSPEAVQALVSMGFPEAESRAALAAAMGNPDLAYEFLLTGIPPRLSQQQQQSAAAQAPPASGGIEQLRQHPQFNMLKRLLQQNPGSLPQVLDLIGQQSPSLLADIHANNDAFVAMMNEPIVESAAAPAPTPAPQRLPPAASFGGGMPPVDAASMIQMLSGMPPNQRAQFAATLGMTPEQLESFMTMMSSMPPEALQSILAGASGGMAGAGRGGGDGQQGVIRLTHDEMEAVNRLVALGFSQQQAAQAYIACDKNEGLAANLLLEGGWGEDDMMMGDGGGAGGFEEGGHDDEDDMYN